MTTTLAAWAVDPTWAVTVQPAGPVAATLNGRSSGVSLVSVRLNGKVASEAPLSCGMSVVRVTSPAALGATRMSTGSVVDAPAIVPRTVIRCGAFGGVGRDRHVERDLRRFRAVGLDPVDGEAATAQDRGPARRDAADRQGDAAGLLRS